MPLPTDGTIYLTACSRPGETSQSRPKQAMVMRMSDSTLDLLEAMPQLHFDFSASPGITIGDTFFSVTSVQETTPHDLYLRTSSAAKRNAPLKLYANVIGKFMVERQLDSRISEMLHESTTNAQNQRAGRTTIFVKTPPDLPPPNNDRKKKKEPTMFRPPPRPADQPRRQAPATSTAPSSSGASAPPPSQRSKEALQALRTRMIRCIALAERTSDQVVKRVGGNDCSASTKRDILDLLDEIAEPIPLPNNSKAPKNYRLKNESWLEVRPYETSGLSESERTSMARSAKIALRALKIPESDPAWSHVQYRNPNGQGSEAPKRGITSSSAKEKKTKAKDTGEIMMKNESLKPPANRPRPGSGFKAKQPTPTESRDFVNGRSPIINGKAVLGESPTATTSDSRRSQSQASEKRISGVPTQNQKIDKLRRDNVAASDSERSERMRKGEREMKSQKDKVREREDRERGERDERDKETEREKERERVRERNRREIERQRERERAKRREAEFESDRERERSRKTSHGRQWSKEREEGERSDDSFRPPKRKKVRQDDEYETSSRTINKKRKMDPPSPRNTRPRDLSLPNKPGLDPPPRPKNLKKEPSPFVTLPKIPNESPSLPPVPKIKDSVTKSSSPPVKPLSAPLGQAPSMKPKPKRRRPEDIYTSSEDEGEIRPLAKREPISATILPTNNNHRNEVSAQSRSHVSKLPPAHDHAALRAHYDSSYIPYLGNFQLLMKHKTKIQNLLRKMDKGSSGSVTESDGDGDLLGPEDLKKLALEYHDQHGDLETIQRIFSRRE